MTGLPPLTVIEASAGTGKTFALVTRLLKLIFSGVEPERIVALTFSRMAAGEIFNSFIERLADAAENDEGAAKESETLGSAHGRADFAAMLRKVISRQHLSSAGTLDSFLMRMLRMFPLELGLDGEVTVMSDFRSPVETANLLGELMMLASDDAKAVFREAFRLMSGAAGAKGFLGSFGDSVSLWHDLYRDNGEAALWGRKETIWGDEPPAGLGEATLARIRALADEIPPHADERGAGTFLDAVRSFGGAVPKLPKCMEEEPLALEAMRLMRLWKLQRELEATQGTYRLMRAYEGAYASRIRRRGLVTFSDMPRLLNSLGDGAKLPLEYRMDARFDHWALDEFQDTSQSQWDAIRNLVEENSREGGGGSVFVVGDRKQSIYEWRGGDVRILESLAKEAGTRGNRLGSLNESYRYVGEISRAVNRIFLEGTVAGEFDMEGAPESAKWRCGEHVSHDAATRGFVEVIDAEKHATGRGSRVAISDFFEPVENALKAVRPWERGITTAVLVRKNREGEALLAHLKAHGVENAVFEGESEVSDSPAIAAMVALVKLAEHSNDAFAYAEICRSPVAEALWGGKAPPPAELSAKLLDEFTRFGMARKFREVREALKKVPGSWNAFTESRFEDFIKCAAEFEALRDSSMRLSDFAGYLAHRKRRDFAEPGMVRIMTMHHSKGLGFDHVIIPFFEPDKLGAPAGRSRRILSGDSPRWLLRDPGAEVADADGVLAAAETRRGQALLYNALCLDYVAMTRAKRALTIILHPRDAKEKAGEPPARFSDLVRRTGLKTDGDREWYLKCGAKEPRAKKSGLGETVARKKRSQVVKSRPGETFFDGLTADRLFDGDFGAAAKRGVEAHEKYAAMEWADGKALSEMPLAFREAFGKPSEDATVWRERGYESFADGKWETGRIDRVVFLGSGAERRAVVYDFKTNAPLRGETAEKFAERMLRSYSRQLRSYADAVSRLAGIPRKNVAAKLLLVANGAAVEI